MPPSQRPKRAMVQAQQQMRELRKELASDNNVEKLLVEHRFK
jgi:hypothetical protein